MAKERNWIDYANLASNLAQNLQLRRANETLEGLERVATERAIREEKQQDQENHLDRLREHVSQIADDVVGLQEHLRENPCAALALGLQIKGLLEKHNVTTASFRAWEDKDRLKDVQKELESVCEQSASLLTDPQRQDAARCAKYLAERDALDQLIGLQRRREVFDLGRQHFEKQLAAKQNELTKLKGEHSDFRLPVWQRTCLVVGGFGLAICALWLVTFCLIGASDRSKPVLPTPDVRMFCLLMFSISLVLVAHFTSAGARRTQLAKQTKFLESEIAKLQVELDRFVQNSPILRQRGLELELGLPDFERSAEQIEIERGVLSQSRATQQRWDELTAMFGAERAAEHYETMKREREAFIQSIFGGLETVPEQRLNDDEQLIERSIEVIRREKKATTSVLQRHLRLSYAQAAEIMDELERRGIVGPTKGAEPRDILIG